MKSFYVTATVVYRVDGDDDMQEDDAIRAVNRGQADDTESIEIIKVDTEN